MNIHIKNASQFDTHHALLVGFFVTFIFDIDRPRRGLPGPCPADMYAPECEGFVFRWCEVDMQMPHRVGW
jgi:hypothetical protein